MSLSPMLRKAAYALPLAFAVAAGSAQALDFGCRDKDQIKKEMVAEGLAPVVRYYESRNKNDLGQTFYIMNPQTHRGYRMDRGYDGLDGQMCIMASVDNVQLYNNKSLDERSYLNAPNADKKGVGINNLIYGSSVKQHENPIFRAVEYSPYHKTTRVIYVLANPDTAGGSVVASSLDGSWLKDYTKGIPSPLTAKVEHGAELTQFGKLMTAENAAPSGSVVAALTPSR